MLYSFGYTLLRRGAPFVPTAQRKLDAIFGPIGLLQSVHRRSTPPDLWFPKSQIFPDRKLTKEGGSTPG